MEDDSWGDGKHTNAPSSREQNQYDEQDSPTRRGVLRQTRDLVLDDPDITTSPMINPFANTKKKGKKGPNTPKNSGLTKK